jgi:hypothetical protein
MKMNIHSFAKVMFVLVLSGCAINNTYYQQQERDPNHYRAGDKSTREQQSRSTPPVGEVNHEVNKPPVEEKPKTTRPVQKPQTVKSSCPPFVLPKIPEVPPLPRDSVEAIRTNTAMTDIERQKALDEIEKQHIIALRADANSLRKDIAEAYEKYKKACH